MKARTHIVIAQRGNGPKPTIAIDADVAGVSIEIANDTVHHMVQFTDASEVRATIKALELALIAWEVGT